MARRLVGLIGRGKGPKLCVEREAQAVEAEVRGLKAGDVVLLEMEDRTSEMSKIELRENGSVFVPVMSFAQFTYLGDNRPICSLKVS